MERMLARLGTVGAAVWRPLRLAPVRAGFYACRGKDEVTRQSSDNRLASDADLRFRFSAHSVLIPGQGHLSPHTPKHPGRFVAFCKLPCTGQ